MSVSVAIPCRTDEPDLGRMLARVLAGWHAVPAAARTPLEILVCLNGEGGEAPAAALARRAEAEAVPLAHEDLDAGDAAGAGPLVAPVAVRVLATRRAGKPIAWNHLRARARGTLALFVDADVAFAPDAFARLLGALATHPAAVLASGRTTCAARAGLLERIQAAPYAVGFPHLSPQLYAARLARLPTRMPEDLIEPERWLELTVGRERMVRVPEAEVVVRLPGSLRDFFRQRIRIEMGKVQMRHDYPALLARSAPQPDAGTVLARLGAAGTVRLAAYLWLRTLAHGLAWWRWRRGHTAGIWRQAASTKEWDAA